MRRKSQVCQKQPLSSPLVTIFDEQNDLKFSHEGVRSIVKVVLSHYEIDTDEVILNFVDTKSICSLHKEYFDDPTVTDCITFPIDGTDPTSTPSLIGEIFICPETGIKHDPENPHRELALYVIHGLLHLIGYDDLTEEDQKVMREEECKCLILLEKEKVVLTNSQALYI